MPQALTVYRTGSEQFTLTEAHPWHIPVGRLDHKGAGTYTRSSDPACARCRTQEEDAMACRTRCSNGRSAIVCGPRIRRPLRRCVVCNISETMATIRLCDAPVGAGTCDAVVCVEHWQYT